MKNITQHTNYPCRKCISEGKETDFFMTKFDKKKLYKKHAFKASNGVKIEMATR